MESLQGLFKQGQAYRNDDKLSCRFQLRQLVKLKQERRHYAAFLNCLSSWLSSLFDLLHLSAASAFAGLLADGAALAPFTAGAGVFGFGN
jgi:hypothetical protein